MLYIAELKTETLLSVILPLDIFQMTYYKFDKTNNKLENRDKNRKEKCCLFSAFDSSFKDEGYSCALLNVVIELQIIIP